MSDNIALYTKYRPKKFKEVLGQEHITEILDQSVKNEDISHAYLFIGSRGTGKTSVARILANEIGTTANDIYEIDAASHTGVDNIRELSDGANVSPFDSKYKVYILDEVHMLSKPAFNALLKTLEEPPKHAIFILATTEANKVPETVISRCEVHNFKTPNVSVLKKMIQSTAKKEGLKLGKGVVDLISILGDGSFRNTHTVLQKVLRTESVVNDSEVTLEEVEKITGAPSSVMVNDVLSALVNSDLVLGLSSVAKAVEGNVDSKVFLKLIIERFRILLLLKVAKGSKELYEDMVSDDDIEFLNGLLEKDSAVVNSLTLSKLIQVSNDSLISHLPLLPLELFLVEIIEEKG